MGSIQQVFLGAICVGGAFLMGHYLNHQTPPSSPFERKSATAELSKSTESLFPKKETTALLPNFRTQSKLSPEFGREKDLPPPSQLDETPSGPSKSNDAPSQIDMANRELDIEVPDFSALASQFKGTALELPALSSAPETQARSNSVQAAPADPADSFQQNPSLANRVYQQEFNDPAANSTSRPDQRNSPHVPANEVAKVPNFRTTINPVEDMMRAELESANPDNSVPEKTETSFRPEDFAPRLRVDDRGSENRPMDVSLEPTRPFETTDLAEVAPFPQTNSVLETSQGHNRNQDVSQSRHPNAVFSYNAPFLSKTDRATNEFHRESIDPPAQFGSAPDSSHSQDFASTTGLAGSDPAADADREPANGFATESSNQWSARDREAQTPIDQRISAQEAATQKETQLETQLESQLRIPFGLSENEKNRLAKLNRPPHETGDTQATRFEAYTTEMGDTLTSISTRFYGKPDYYLDIYLVNRNQLRNPAQVPAGITLRLPVYE